MDPDRLPSENFELAPNRIGPDGRRLSPLQVFLRDNPDTVAADLLSFAHSAQNMASFLSRVLDRTEFKHRRFEVITPDGIGLLDREQGGKLVCGYAESLVNCDLPDGFIGVDPCDLKAGVHYLSQSPLLIMGDFPEYCRLTCDAPVKVMGSVGHGADIAAIGRNYPEACETMIEVANHARHGANLRSDRNILVRGTDESTHVNLSSDAERQGVEARLNRHARERAAQGTGCHHRC